MSKYRPTFEGLQKLQQFLAQKNHPMPIFEMNIGSGFINGGQVLEDSGIELISIEEAIMKYGAKQDVINVRLSSVDGDDWITFLEASRYNLNTFLEADEMGFACVVNCSGHLYDFFRELGGPKFLRRIARWGREGLSMKEAVETFWFKFSSI